MKMTQVLFKDIGETLTLTLDDSKEHKLISPMTLFMDPLSAEEVVSYLRHVADALEDMIVNSKVEDGQPTSGPGGI